MADHFYSVVLGDQAPYEVTVGTSTSSESVELRVHDGDGWSKKDLAKALMTISEYIVTHDVPA